MTLSRCLVPGLLALSLSACSGTEGDGGSDSGTETAGIASGSAAAGEAVFRQCAACHSVEPGESRVGPSLHAVVGREIGGISGFRYSSANEAMTGGWTRENLDAYLESPRIFMPGTTMAFAGLSNAQDRADLIAYLETLN